MELLTVHTFYATVSENLHAPLPAFNFTYFDFIRQLQFTIHPDPVGSFCVGRQYNVMGFVDLQVI